MMDHGHEANGKPAEDETNREVSSLRIERLDGGGYLYEVSFKPKKKSDAHGPVMESYSPPKRYSFESVEGVLDAVEDDLGSPHDKKMRLGGGGRFQHLKSKLAGEVRNPAAVAAAIGRKKYGKAKFQKLAASGNKKGGLFS